MFDFSFSELIVIGVIALVVLGPERLPKVARAAGSLMGRVQRMVNNVKQELNAQIEMDELKKAKSEFESAAYQFRDEIRSVGDTARSELSDVATGLEPPAWERLPPQRTPADFGVDEQGQPLAQSVVYREAWQANEAESIVRPTGAVGFQTASVHKKAMQKKRDMRPRYRPKPRLRVRKK
ncbi:preprotein translocase subunit TatB [Neisseria arctica]|uniref:Sec-independent protein translocase protein TatB n=1 Tax=Neisseria arctica TaxID=1470200 RepID=A0A0J1C2U1_9NEIS|nr:Sec-independent protein translocase protein TatB [Neisseria arctica]KLT72633.1 preprotein translocase subunit TatB [Neisseria arctica]UOO86284.1 Sec-independent protein translocase protein TatB [Neisseria arctica]